MDLVKIAEEAFACGKEHPEFRSGDTVTVSYRIKEGNKSVSSNSAEMLSVSRVTVTKSVSRFVKCRVM